MAQPGMIPLAVGAVTLARHIHETSERLAPSYLADAVSTAPWEELPQERRELLTAVCADVLAGLRDEMALELECRLEKRDAELASLRAALTELATMLGIVLRDLHPAYANTAGRRGGVGGQTLTPGCAVIDPRGNQVELLERIRTRTWDVLSEAAAAGANLEQVRRMVLGGRGATE